MSGSEKADRSKEREVMLLFECMFRRRMISRCRFMRGGSVSAPGGGGVGYGRAGERGGSRRFLRLRWARGGCGWRWHAVVSIMGPWALSRFRRVRGGVLEGVGRDGVVRVRRRLAGVTLQPAGALVVGFGHVAGEGDAGY